MSMKPTTIILGVIGLVVVILFGMTCSNYNGMVSGEEKVEKSWANVESAYQSRADKTKNLIEIVKGAADFEKGALQDIVEARSKATSIQLSADDLTPEKLAAFEKAQGQFGNSIGRLLAIAENYPNLKSVDAFRDFQVQYEGMENRIKKARDDFNKAVEEYNKKIKRMPGKLFNSMLGWGFEKKAYFKAQAGAEEAPEIKF
jgi:LemA protein